MKKKIPTTSLRKFHLWSDLPGNLWQVLSEGIRWIDVAPGETVFPSPDTNQCLCVLWQGQARVLSCSSTPAHPTLLRTMQSGAIFGVHSIFNSEIPPQSTIIAERPCRIVLIPATLWEKILTSHAPTMASYVVFLTQRIGFLNSKIQYLTAGSAERRLSLYLASQIPEDNSPTRLDITAVSLADLLDLGRASLYRALDKLTADGFLIRDGHTYTLCNRKEMFSHYS